MAVVVGGHSIYDPGASLFTSELIAVSIHRYNLADIYRVTYVLAAKVPGYWVSLVQNAAKTSQNQLFYPRKGDELVTGTTFSPQKNS